MVIRENDDAIHDGIRTFPEDPVKELIFMIHITCEGRSFDFFDGATPQNLWNMVRGTRGKEAAVLAGILSLLTSVAGLPEVTE